MELMFQSQESNRMQTLFAWKNLNEEGALMMLTTLSICIWDEEEEISTTIATEEFIEVRDKFCSVYLIYMSSLLPWEYRGNMYYLLNLWQQHSSNTNEGMNFPPRVESI